MCFVKVFAIFIGAVMLFTGCMEMRVSMWSSTKPVPVKLTDLEAGEKLGDNHIKVDEHFALLAAGMYEYKSSTASFGPAPDDAKVTHVLYPIVSSDKIQELAGKTDFKELAFSVLVRTERYKTAGALNDIIDKPLEPTVGTRGLVMLRGFYSLEADEQRSLKARFPKLDVDNLVVIEEGAKPRSMMVLLFSMFVGACFVLAGVVLFLPNEKS